MYTLQTPIRQPLDTFKIPSRQPADCRQTVTKFQTGMVIRSTEVELGLQVGVEFDNIWISTAASCFFYHNQAPLPF